MLHETCSKQICKAVTWMDHQELLLRSRVAAFELGGDENVHRQNKLHVLPALVL
jgi:hypothetical protein